MSGTVAEVVAEVEALGGEFRLANGRVKATFPEGMQQLVVPLLERLRADREALADVLRARRIPPMPVGVRLIGWELKSPPVVLERWSVVNDVAKFAIATLRQLELALAGECWLAGNWSPAELVDRLAAVGVLVEVQAESGIRK